MGASAWRANAATSICTPHIFNRGNARDGPAPVRGEVDLRVETSAYLGLTDMQPAAYRARGRHWNDSMAKRVRIKPPPKTIDEIAYPVECREALEPSLAGLIDRAANAGWDRKQVALAIMFIAARMAKELNGDVEPADAEA